MIYTELKTIAALFGVHYMTIRNWIKKHGFPASRLPDGTYMTTDSLIDSWILARANQQREERAIQPVNTEYQRNYRNINKLDTVKERYNDNAARV